MLSLPPLDYQPDLGRAPRLQGAVEPLDVRSLSHPMTGAASSHHPHWAVTVPLRFWGCLLQQQHILAKYTPPWNHPGSLPKHNLL